MLLVGCSQFGPLRLDDDQLGYVRALSSGQKQQTLLNIVQLRYGDTPAFLDATQVISAYQRQRNVTGGFEALPGETGSYITGTGSYQLQESPTFTFQPVAGEQFAQNFLRPLSPSEILPLITGGLPIDVVFRLGVESVNRVRNGTALGGPKAGESPEFMELLRELRVLQIAGLLTVRFVEPAKQDPKAAARARTFIALVQTDDPTLNEVEADVRRKLGMRPGAASVEVVYGVVGGQNGVVALDTRTMLGVLAYVAFQIEAPADDIAANRTMPAIAHTRRPVIVIHSAPREPKEAFVRVRYNKTWFFISDTDFDSKVAFTILQTLLALAKTSTAPGAIVTIPAG
ncbi:hypothetical protein [Rhizosaccharibacter radicis]|uniref:Peptidoglycan-binding protein n=1 Tax=Rhizosaccharibacter radicis TaxID=2782605 RepID=A0ABT1VW92_9PROT|nr:hypothetical protein [Acetobacteraceae bacterium KSS12]